MLLNLQKLLIWTKRQDRTTQCLAQKLHSVMQCPKVWPANFVASKITWLRVSCCFFTCHLGRLDLLICCCPTRLGISCGWTSLLGKVMLDKINAHSGSGPWGCEGLEWRASSGIKQPSTNKREDGKKDGTLQYGIEEAQEEHGLCWQYERLDIVAFLPSSPLIDPARKKG